MDRILPWLVSVVLHLGVLGALALVPVTVQSRRSPAPIQVELVDLAPPDPPPPLAKPEPPARVAERPRPRPTLRPSPRPSRTPRPSPSPSASPLPVATPLPTTTPAVDETAEKIRTLRQVPGYEDKTDEELANEPLPPGVESWAELAEIFKKLNGLKMELPPDVGTSRPPAADVAMDYKQDGGRHELYVQSPQGQYWVQWNEGDAEAVGFFFVPGNEADGRAVKVAVDRDVQKMVAALLQPVASPP